MSTHSELAKPGTDWRPPKRLLVIAGFFRCGSSYLGSLLHSTGRLGRPDEYFNPKYEPLTAYMSGGKINFSAAFKSVCERATTENGICSFKMFPAEFEFIVRHCDFAAWFPETRFVWLQRADVLAQAISLLIAGQTGTWQQTTVAKRTSVHFDRIQVERSVKDIADSYLYWTTFFARNGIVPKVIMYEFLCRQPTAVVCEIAELLDCQLPQSVNINSMLKRQSDQLNIYLRQAYLGEQKRFSAVGAAAKRVLPRTIGSLWSLIRKRPI